MIQRLSLLSVVMFVANGCVAAAPRVVVHGRFAEGLPAWSRDGSKIAYVQRGTARKRELWCVGQDGTGARRLAADVASRTELDWSPEGKWLTYMGKGKKRGAMVVRADGKTRPTLLVPGARLPRWSPDGSSIACVDGTNLFLVGLDGKTTRLTNEKPPAIFRGLAWSPAGSTIASDRNGDIYVARVRPGTRWELVASHSTGDAPPFRRPAFSADSKLLYFTVDRAGVYDAACGSDGLARVRLGTAAPEILCDAESWTLARGANLIALVRGGDIYLRDPTTGRERVAARGIMPALSHNGRKLAFVEESDTNGDGTVDFRDEQRLMVMDVPGPSRNR